jgi:hypothetical protein
MIHPKVAAEMSGREIFAHALRDSISDVLLYGVGAVVIILLGSLSWWLGLVLSGLFAVIVLVSVIQTGAVTVLGLASIPLAINEKRQGRYVDWGEQVYLAVANVIKILDKAILVAYTYVLYRVYF